MAGRGKRIRRRVLELLDLPAYMDPDVPRMTVMGNAELLLENHAGVLQYADTLVRFLTPLGPVRIEGEGLRLHELTGEQAFVCGRLTSWRFEDGI